MTTLKLLLLLWCWCYGMWTAWRLPQCACKWFSLCNLKNNKIKKLKKTTALVIQLWKMRKDSSLSKKRFWHWKWVEGRGFDQFPVKLCIIDKTQVESAPGDFWGWLFSQCTRGRSFIRSVVEHRFQCRLCQKGSISSMTISAFLKKTKQKNMDIWMDVFVTTSTDSKSVDSLQVILVFFKIQANEQHLAAATVKKTKLSLWFLKSSPTLECQKPAFHGCNSCQIDSDHVNVKY